MENSNKQDRRPQIGFEANPELVAELREVSDRIQIPGSQIAREALWEKLATIKSTHPAYATAAEPATA